MTSIDAVNNESLADMNCIETSSNSESLVDTVSLGSNSGETLIVNDPNALRLVLNSKTAVSKKHKFRLLYFILSVFQVLFGYHYHLFYRKRTKSPLLVPQGRIILTTMY